MNRAKNEISILSVAFAFVVMTVSIIYIDLSQLVPILAFELSLAWFVAWCYVNIKEFYKQEKEEREDK